MILALLETTGFEIEKTEKKMQQKGVWLKESNVPKHLDNYKTCILRNAISEGLRCIMSSGKHEEGCYTWSSKG